MAADLGQEGRLVLGSAAQEQRDGAGRLPGEAGHLRRGAGGVDASGAVTCTLPAALPPCHNTCTLRSNGTLHRQVFVSMGIILGDALYIMVKLAALAYLARRDRAAGRRKGAFVARQITLRQATLPTGSHKHEHGDTFADVDRMPTVRHHAFSRLVAAVPAC